MMFFKSLVVIAYRWWDPLPSSPINAMLTDWAFRRPFMPNQQQVRHPSAD